MISTQILAIFAMLSCELFAIGDFFRPITDEARIAALMGWL